MDNSWRWFFSGILIGLICTALTLLIVDPIGRFGLRADGIGGLGGRANTPAVAAERTFILVVDEGGRVVSQRTELTTPAVETPTPLAPAAPDGAAPPAEPTPPAAPTPTPTPGLTLGKAIFAKVEQPSFVTAREGLAYVVTRKLELKTVNYKGEVKTVSTDIKDLGASRIADVDVSSDGSVYALVVDGPFEWRVFRKPASASAWSQVGSEGSSGWPAALQAMAVTDTGAVYLSASDPAGVFRLEADGKTLRPWVEGGRALGLDAAGDDSRLMYVVPETAPRRPDEQVRVVQSGAAQRWLSTYAPCADSKVSPVLPRDVVVLPANELGGEPALIVDSNNVVWYQERFGAGYPVFGVPCEGGSDDQHLNGPRGAAIDNLGNVFISDAGNGRIVVLPKPGAVPTATPKAKATPKATEAPAVAAPPSPPSSSGPPPAPLTSIEFGNPGACPPAGRCPEADVLIPRDTTVRMGDSVRFNIRAQSHQVAIYAPGTRVEDIQREILGGVAGTPGANAILIDPNRRVTESPVLPFVQPAPTEWDWDTRGLGRGAYLVICTFRPHLEDGMYGTIVLQ
ncbi:MAG: hypothetical protein IT299_01560 [Dehalococcoidia bacterium]|nr:hypothetical protein [Dehalococcoidia bacterium]